MTDHAQHSGPISGSSDGAGYSNVGREPVASEDPRLSEPHGELTGHAGGVPHSTVGHGPVASTVRDSESIRQSQIAAREPLQHDGIGNAIVGAAAAVPLTLAASAYVGAVEVAGAIGKAVFGVGKEAAKEGVEYTFKHMDDPSLHKADAPDGGVGDAGHGAATAHDHTVSPGPGMSQDHGTSQDPGMSQDHGTSQDPGMSQDHGVCQDPGMSHNDGGYFHH